MTLFTAIIMGILGSAVGSFLSVVVHRIKKKKKGIIFGKSMCPHCKKPLKWKHLVPVISFMFLRGKCAFCGKKISKHYFALELLTALIFVVTFLNWNFIVSTPSSIDPSILSYSINWKIFEISLFYIIEMTLLMGIFFYDLLYQEIPDVLSVPAIVLAIVAAIGFGGPALASIGIGIAIILIFFGGQILISKGEWLGGGDLRLGVLMAVMLGWKYLLLALIISYVFGALVSIVLLLSDKANRKTAVPFGPFLITGTLVTLFLGSEIISAYMHALGI